MKQSRKKKDSVAPINDNEDTPSALHPDRPRQGSRGVSFSTSRGKIWLILIANLAIITSFIFMSSSRFPSLYGEGIVNDALEQDRPHRGPVIKNDEQILSFVVEDTAVTKEPRIHVQDSTHSGGYTKLTRTDQHEAADEDSRSETQALLARETRVEEANETPVTVDQAEETQSVTEQTTAPTSGDSSSETTSSVRSDGQNSPVGSSGQEPQSETLSPLPEQSNEIEYSSISSTAKPQSEVSGPSTVGSEVMPRIPAFEDNLAVWLTSDWGVEVEHLTACLASSGKDLAACEVKSWTSQITSSDLTAGGSVVSFAASPQRKILWIPIDPDTHNQLPTVQFSCPMTTDALKVHESMTLFFVLSAAQSEAGDSFTGQKFFGNSPYGQFALHSDKPSFFANNGLVEHTHTLPAGQFSLVTYRLHQRYVEIKANSGPWSGETQEKGGSDGTRIRITVNEVVSLGNSKSACDTNAFQGRIAEVLVYDAVLEDAKVAIVEKYLHDKWWGKNPFPEPAALAVPTESPKASTVNAPDESATNTSLAAKPVDRTTEEATVTPEVDPQVIKVTLDASPGEKAEATKQTSTATGVLAAQRDHSTNGPAQETPVAAVEDAAPTFKFDPRINIFEWKPPIGADATKATQWTKTVKEKVNYIRNFQLGGDVLRALIREHKDGLIALREELFG
ncbi:hypothetical protein DVH05_010579 [Phytophthora capsici]|nr:hypothetical protein DVH05_010579 [Phytophthora capsici]